MKSTKTKPGLAAVSHLDHLENTITKALTVFLRLEIKLRLAEILQHAVALSTCLNENH